MDYEEIHRRYFKGETQLKDLAKEFKCHTSTLRSNFKRLGLPKRPRSLPDSFFIEIHPEYLAGASPTELSEKYGSSPAAILRAFKKLGLKVFTIQETQESNKKKREKTLMERYGVNHYSKTAEFKKSFEETCLRKYGKKTNLQHEDTKKKIRETNLERYGGTAPSCSEKVKSKIKKTTKDRYGVDHLSQTKEFQERRTETVRKRYGGNSPASCPTVRQKARETNLERYGVEHPQQSKEVREKTAKTNLEKYGVLHPSQNEEVALRISASKKNKHESLKRNQMLEEGFTLLGDYKGKQVSIGQTYEGFHEYQVRHECGHEFTTNLNNPLRCPKCLSGKSRSLEESNLCNFLRETTGKDILNNQRIERKEIDILIPDLGVGFEYNSSFYHSTLFKTKSYHKKKTEMALKHDIDLYHVWDWMDVRKVKDRILSILGGNPQRLYARNLDVVKNHEGVFQFFFDNHIHGNALHNFSFSLVRGTKPIAVMSIRKHKEGFEIARYAVVGSTQVIGGFQRLLSYCIEEIQRLGGKILITFADRDFSPDYKKTVYYRQGFTFLGDSGPSLAYTKRGEVIARQHFQKHKLRELFPDTFDEKLSADQILYKNGIFGFYNSGNFKFRLEV